MVDTKELARELLAKNILNEPAYYSIQDLFRIRDLCLGLAFYGLEDKSLLDETLRYIEQEANK